MYRLIKIQHPSLHRKREKPKPMEAEPEAREGGGAEGEVEAGALAGLTAEEREALRPTIAEYHRYIVGLGRCSSLLVQRVRAPAEVVWSIVRRFDRPQIYKHFIRSCSIVGGDSDIKVGCLREVSIISGLPASTSTERLDILDEERRVTCFTIIGGEHRLKNYRSVTTVTEFAGDRQVWSLVLESYVVDVPEGNTEEDTRLFADTVVRLNLQKLASFAETMASPLQTTPPPGTQQA